MTAKGCCCLPGRRRRVLFVWHNAGRGLLMGCCCACRGGTGELWLIGEEELEVGCMRWRVGGVDAVEAEARWGLALGWRLDGAARRRGGVAAAGPAEERRCRRRIPAMVLEGV